MADGQHVNLSRLDRDVKRQRDRVLLLMNAFDEDHPKTVEYAEQLATARLALFKVMGVAGRTVAYVSGVPADVQNDLVGHVKKRLGAVSIAKRAFVKAMVPDRENREAFVKESAKLRDDLVDREEKWDYAVSTGSVTSKPVLKGLSGWNLPAKAVPAAAELAELDLAGVSACLFLLDGEMRADVVVELDECGVLFTPTRLLGHLATLTGNPAERFKAEMSGILGFRPNLAGMLRAHLGTPDEGKAELWTVIEGLGYDLTHVGLAEHLHGLAPGERAEFIDVARELGYRFELEDLLQYRDHPAHRHTERAWINDRLLAAGYDTSPLGIRERWTVLSGRARSEFEVLMNQMGLGFTLVDVIQYIATLAPGRREEAVDRFVRTGFNPMLLNLVAVLMSLPEHRRGAFINAVRRVFKLDLSEAGLVHHRDVVIRDEEERTEFVGELFHMGVYLPEPVAETPLVTFDGIREVVRAEVGELLEPLTAAPSVQPVTADEVRRMLDALREELNGRPTAEVKPPTGLPRREPVADRRGKDQVQKATGSGDAGGDAGVVQPVADPKPVVVRSEDRIAAGSLLDDAAVTNEVDVTAETARGTGGAVTDEVDVAAEPALGAGGAVTGEVDVVVEPARGAGEVVTDEVTGEGDEYDEYLAFASRPRFGG